MDVINMETIILKNIIAVLVVINLLTALFILFYPRTLRRLNDFLNIWVSTRRLLRPLEVVKSIDDQIYKRHKILGISFLLFTPISKNISGVLPMLILLTALFILFCPRALRRLNDFLDIRVSTRRLLRPLEIVRNIDDQIYKRHKILGISFLIFTSLLIRCYIIF